MSDNIRGVTAELEMHESNVCTEQLFTLILTVFHAIGTEYDAVWASERDTLLAIQIRRPDCKPRAILKYIKDFIIT